MKTMSVEVLSLYHRETRISVAQGKYYPEQAAEAGFYLHLLLSSIESFADQT